jgi:hypothetical protein
LCNSNTLYDLLPNSQQPGGDTNYEANLPQPGDDVVQVPNGDEASLQSVFTSDGANSCNKKRQSPCYVLANSLSTFVADPNEEFAETVVGARVVSATYDIVVETLQIVIVGLGLAPTVIVIDVSGAQSVLAWTSYSLELDTAHSNLRNGNVPIVVSTLHNNTVYFGIDDGANSLQYVLKGRFLSNNTFAGSTIKGERVSFAPNTWRIASANATVAMSLTKTALQSSDFVSLPAGTDMLGNDMPNMPLRGVANATACQVTCSMTVGCVAYAYSTCTTDSQYRSCWLKSDTGARSLNACRQCGVKVPLTNGRLVRLQILVVDAT